MPIYKCLGCSHETDRKTNIKNHVTKISKCFEFTQNIDERYTIDDKDCISHTCNFCSKKLYSVSNKKRHEKICKTRKEEEKDNGEISTIINNTNNNTINNTLNDNRVINITIVVNSYDKPNIESIRDQIKECIENFAGTDECIPKVFKTIYFNKDFPQNHSIKYTNEKTDKVLVHNGKNFEPRLFSDIKDTLIDKVENTVNHVSSDMSLDINKKLDEDHKKKYEHGPRNEKMMREKEFRRIKLLAHDNNKMVNVANTENTENVENAMNIKNVDDNCETENDIISKIKNRSKIMSKETYSDTQDVSFDDVNLVPNIVKFIDKDGKVVNKISYSGTRC
jgi:hypothetical protein